MKLMFLQLVRKTNRIFRPSSIVVIVGLFLLTNFYAFYWITEKTHNYITGKVESQCKVVSERVTQFFSARIMSLKLLGDNVYVRQLFLDCHSGEEARNSPLRPKIQELYDTITHILTDVDIRDKNSNALHQSLIPNIASVRGNFLFTPSEICDETSQPQPWYTTQQEWYSRFSKVNGAVCSDIFLVAATGKYGVSLFQRLTDGDEVIGCVAMAVVLSTFSESIRKIEEVSTGTVLLLDSQQNIVYQSGRTDYIQDNLKDRGGDYKQVSDFVSDSDSITSGTVVIGKESYYACCQQIVVDETQTSDWHALILLDKKEAQRAFSSTFYAMLLIGAVDLTLFCLPIIVFSIRERKAKMQLLEAKILADSANKAKSNFLAKMSHEIRSPMNAVISMSELILREKATPLVEQYANDIKLAGTNLLTIINDILDFSKIESDRLELVNEEYDFTSLINDSINVVKFLIADQQIRFYVDIDPTVPGRLFGDQVRVREVLVNLLTNAVKYTRKGYVLLTVRCNRTSLETVHLMFAVEDTGIGIKEQDIPNLFSDFVQFDKKINAGIQGTGLGLAIAKKLAVLLGGDVAVKSQYGIGSTFTFVLPQRVRVYVPFAEVNEPNKFKILLYDRRQKNTDILIRTFYHLKLHCRYTDNLPQLLELLKEDHYNYLLTHNLDGETLAKIRAAAPDIHITLMLDSRQSVLDDNISVLDHPVYCTSLTNLLNGVVQKKKNDYGVYFTAPEARVLVVDDMEVNLRIAEGLMLPFKMRVDTAKSGQEAVDMIKLNRYDLVFMDHMMPEMDGIEVTQLIRTSTQGDTNYFAHLPIIALTANAVVGMKEMFLEAGFSGFLSKPIEIPKLNACIEQWIPKRLQIPIAAKTRDNL